MLAYCMWGYIDFAHKLVARLAGGAGGPSAVSMGKNMSSTLGDKALSGVGLDARSRANMIQGIKDMRSSMRTGKKINPKDAYNRHDGGQAAQNNSKTGAPRSNLSSKLSQSVGQAASHVANAMARAKKSWGAILPGKKTDAQGKEGADGTADEAKTDNAKAQNNSSRRSNLFGVSRLLGGSKKQKDEGASADADQKSATSSDADLKDAAAIAASKGDVKTDTKSSRSDDAKTDAKKDAKAMKSDTDAKEGEASPEKSAQQDAVVADDAGANADSSNAKTEQVKRSDSTIEDKTSSKEDLKSEEKSEQESLEKKAEASDERQKEAKTDSATDLGAEGSASNSEPSESAKVNRSGGESAGSLEQKEQMLREKDSDSEDKGARDDRLNSQEFDSSSAEATPRASRNRVEGRDSGHEEIRSDEKSEDDSEDQQTKGKKGSKE